MKENMKKVYLTPSVQVKLVAVENGFGVSNSLISTEEVGRTQDFISF